MNRSDYVTKTLRYQGKKYFVYGKTEAEALEKRGKLRAELENGTHTVGGSMTVSAWYAEWKSLYKDSSGLTEKSLAMYDQKFNGYIRPAIGRMKLQDVRDVHLQRILNNQAGMSQSHVSKIRIVIKSMFSRARKSRLIAIDPSEDLVLPATTKGSRRSLTPAERAALLEVAEWHPSGLWVLTMLYTGMRPGEIAALQWRDVDFKANEIHVHQAVESGSANVKAPKTEAGLRDIPMIEPLRRKLEAAKGSPLALVFPSSSGKRRSAVSFAQLWKSFRRQMDIAMGAQVYRNQIVVSKIVDPLPLYCLRHTFCTDLEAAGVPINVAKTLMGHSDISVTANIYTHKNADLLHSEIIKLETAGSNGGSKKHDTA